MPCNKLKKNKVNMWVHPEFKKMLKKEAAQAEETMLIFTEKIAKKERRTSEKDGFQFFI